MTILTHFNEIVRSGRGLQIYKDFPVVELGFGDIYLVLKV